jgi:hypothetical protein
MRRPVVLPTFSAILRSKERNGNVDPATSSCSLLRSVDMSKELQVFNTDECHFILINLRSANKDIQF